MEREPFSVSVRVQIGDTSLIYQQKDDVVGINHFLVGEGKRGNRFEYVYPILHHPRWKMGDEFVLIQTEMFHPVHSMLEQLHGEYCPNYIVWGSLYKWYRNPSKKQQETGITFGVYIGWEISYVVYIPPKDGGFERLFREADIATNVELSERTMVKGTLERDEDYERASIRLMGLAHTFQAAIYETGLGKIINASKGRGMSGNFNGVEMMSWVMCGRIMITLEAPNPMNPKLRDSFTVIGNESVEEPNFGWRSIAATGDRAAELVQLADVGWLAIPKNERAKHFSDSKEVKLAGMP